MLESKDNNNEFIIKQQGSQIDEYKKMSNDLKDELKSTQNKTLAWKIGTFVGIIGTYIIIKK